LRGKQLQFIGITAAALAMFSMPVLAEVAKMVPLATPDGETILEVHGVIAVANRDGAAVFDLAMLKALPAVQLETSTAVTDGVRRFDGFLMRDLLARVGANGVMVTATALNEYVMEFAVDEFDKFDVLVAYAMDGAPLLASDKGPLWIVYPRDQHLQLQDIRYDYRWVWQLTRLDVE
jgi:hypothetical protein